MKAGVNINCLNPLPEDLYIAYIHIYISIKRSVEDAHESPGN